MTPIAERVLKALLELPTDERIEIADRLYQSVETAESATEWQAFIEERLAQADRGEFVEGTVDEMIEGIRRELGLKPQ